MSGQAGDGWLEAGLRSARPAPIDDAGFSTAVLARIAACAAARPTQGLRSTLSAMEALEAMRRSVSDERRFGHWTLGGVTLGACVALGLTATAPGMPGPDPSSLGAGAALPALALLGASCLIALLLLRSPLR